MQHLGRVFPTVNHAMDGHVGVAPVMTYPPNDIGIWDLGGNVWELCEDWYAPIHTKGLIRQRGVIRKVCPSLLIRWSPWCPRK